MSEASPKPEFAERFWRGLWRTFLCLCVFAFISDSCRDDTAVPGEYYDDTAGTPAATWSPPADLQKLLDDIRSTTLVAHVCADGWRSPSSGQGTCSHHGGIRWTIWNKNGSEVTCPARGLMCP